MRFPPKRTRSFILCLICAISLPAWSGCRSSNRNQREVALLRAEILDLEDQYYALKSRCEHAEGQLAGASTAPCVDCNPTGEQVYIEGPEIVYEGQTNGGLMNEIVGSGRCYEDEMIVSDGYPQPGGSPIIEPSVPSRYRPAAERRLGVNTQTSTDWVQPAQQRPRWLENFQSLFGRGRNSSATTRRRPWFPAPPFRRESQTPNGALARLQARMTNRTQPRTPESATLDLDPDIDVVIPKLDTSENNLATAEPSTLGMESFESDPLDLEIELNEPELDYMIDSEQVAEIYIARDLTMSRNLDGRPGDEGIELLLQPKTELGDIVLKPAKTTVRVVDPREIGSRQQIGSWQFTADEIALFANDDASQPGYRLHLPWDQRVPRNRSLMIFVSYATDDGRTLETRQDLTITPPDSTEPVDLSLITGWTKRDRKWDANSPNAENLARESSTGSASADRDFIRPRNNVPARPASTTIPRPKWRPSR